MPMPNNLTFVRHGQSEANIIQGQLKNKHINEVPTWYTERPDFQMRLTSLGQEQAEAAGEWLAENGMTEFDRTYSSPYFRTIETAGLLAVRAGLDGEWHLEDRLRERDWGVYGVLDVEARKQDYFLSSKRKDIDPLYWAPDGGESVSTVANTRVRDLFGTLQREQEGRDVLVVTHGEFMWAVRFIAEKMLPIEWIELDQDKSQRIQNCMILQYTRIDPETGEQAPHLRWMRAICPWDDRLSYNGGQWKQIRTKVAYSPEELFAIANKAPRMLAEH